MTKMEVPKEQIDLEKKQTAIIGRDHDENHRFIEGNKINRKGHKNLLKIVDPLEAPFTIIRGNTPLETLENNGEAFTNWAMTLATRYTHTKVGLTMAKLLAQKIIPNISLDAGIDSNADKKAFKELDSYSMSELRAMAKGEVPTSYSIIEDEPKKPIHTNPTTKKESQEAGHSPIDDGLPIVGVDNG